MMSAPTWWRRTLRMRPGHALTLAAIAVAAWGCGGEAGDGEARVFFAAPQDGATVESPVELVFGAENVEIGAVPEEVETPRPGVVHYHLGVDASCLPPGTRIPEADPWIHFGDGSDRIETQLAPGEHRLVVQAGDDEHRTIEGLCETISITVTEEG